jgi:hypothetical protein
MNYWIQQSIEYAENRSYLDDLFSVYPINQEINRKIADDIRQNIEFAFRQKDNVTLIKELLKLDLFPLKDSYVAFLRDDLSAIERNPRTVNRLCGSLYQMGLEKMFDKCTEPKETNRQMGQAFRNWLKKGSLGVQPVSLEEFTSSTNDAILDGGDKILATFAKEYLNYTDEKGLDFIGRFKGKYVIGEAKFITSQGGNQDKSLVDAARIVQNNEIKAVKVAILDGVLYIKSQSGLYRKITENYKDLNILSALLLRDFLYSL